MNVSDITKKKRAVQPISYTAAITNSAAGSQAKNASADLPEEKTWLEKTGDAISTTYNNVANAVENAVSTGYNYISNLIGGESEQEPVAPVPVASEPETPAYNPAASTGNYSTQKTSLEFYDDLLEMEQNAIRDYDSNVNYAEQVKEDALRLQEQAKTNAKIEAEAQFRQNASNYGLRGEQMLSQGLAGGGYSEHLEGKNMEQRTIANAMANANYLANAQTIQSQHNENLRAAEKEYQAAQDNLIKYKKENNEQMRAELNAKFDDIIANVTNGVMGADIGESIYMALASQYGIAMSEEQRTALKKAEKNSSQNIAAQIWDDLVDKYGDKLTYDQYYQALVANRIDGENAKLITDAYFGVVSQTNKEERNAFIASLIDSVAKGERTIAQATAIAKYSGFELTADEMQDLETVAGEYQTKTNNAELSALVDKAMSMVLSMGEKVTRGNVEGYLAAMPEYSKYSKQLTLYLNHMFNADGTLNVNNRSDYAAKLDELYSRVNNDGMTPDEATSILEAWGYSYDQDVINNLEIGYKKYKENLANQTVQNMLASIVGSEGFTKDTLEAFLDTNKKIDDETKSQIIASYFNEDGTRVDLETVEERKTKIVTMIDAVRAGTYNLENAKRILNMQLAGNNLNSYEISALESAYNEYVTEAKKKAVDELAYYFDTLGGEPSRGVAVLYASTLGLGLTDEQIIDIVDAHFDSDGNFVYKRTIDLSENNSGTSGNKLTNEQLNEMLQFITGDSDAKVEPDGSVSEEYYRQYIIKYAQNRGITLTEEQINELIKPSADGKYYIDENSLAALFDEMKNGGKDNNDEKPEDEKPSGDDSGEEGEREAYRSTMLASFEEKMLEHSVGPNGEMAAIIKDFVDTAKNNGLFTEEEIGKFESIFNGYVETSATFRKNDFDTSFGEGDDFSIEMGGKRYGVESDGRADDSIQQFAKNNNLRDGKVFGYKSELYLVAGNEVIKIKARKLFYNGDYEKLWKAVYAENLKQFMDGTPVDVKPTNPTGKGGYVSNLSEDEGSGETNDDILRGYAHIVTIEKSNDLTGSGGVAQTKVNIGGNNYNITIGDALAVGDPLWGTLSGAANFDEGEVFVYANQIYAKYGDQIVKIDASKKTKEKIINAISENANDRTLYNDDAVALGGKIDDKGFFPTYFNKLPETMSDDTYMRLEYNGTKYSLKIHAILGEGTEAARAAQKANIQDGAVFAHHEDMYIYSGGKAYKLGATPGVFNKDYDKFKAATTGKDISSEYIFGNKAGTSSYIENLGGGSEGGSGGSEGGSEDDSDKVATSTQVDLNTADADQIKGYVQNALDRGREEIYYTKDDMEAVAKRLGIKDVNAFLGKLETKTENGQTLYKWYLVPANSTLADIEGVTISEKGYTGKVRTLEDGTLKFDFRIGLDWFGGDKSKIALEEVSGSELNEVGYRDSCWFSYGDELYYYDKSSGSGKVYKVIGGVEDAEAMYDGKLPEGSVMSTATENAKENLENRELTRGGANFESHGAWFGVDKGFKKGDEITVEIGGKSYWVSSGGETFDKYLIAAAAEAGVHDGEVFKYGESIYMKKNGKFYSIEGMWFGSQEDEKLSEAIVAKSKTTGEAESTVKRKADVKYDKNAVGRDEIDVEYKDNKYRVAIGAVLSDDNAAYKAASDNGIKSGELFTYGDDLYVMREKSVYKLSSRSGNKETYDDLKKIVNGEKVVTSEKEEKKAALQKLEITRAGANFESHGTIVGMDWGMTKGDNISVELGGESFLMESDGKVSDLEKEAIKEKTKNLGIHNGEVFKLGKDLILKYDGEYYKLRGMWAGSKEDENLSKKFDQYVKEDASNPDGSSKHVPDSTTSGKVPTFETAEGEKVIQVKYEGTAKGRDAIKIDFNGEKYKVYVSAVLGDDSAQYKAAKNLAKEGKLEEDDVFFWGGVGYVYKKDSVYKLTSKNGKYADYNALLKNITYIRTGNATVGEVYGIKVDGKKVTANIKDAEYKLKYDGSSYDLTKSNNELIASAAEQVPEGQFFEYNGKLYHLVDKNTAKGLTDGDSTIDDTKKALKKSSADTFDSLNIPGVKADNTSIKEGGYLDNFLNGANQSKTEYTFELNDGSDIFLDMDKEDTKIGTIVEIYGPDHAKTKKAESKGAKERDIIISGENIYVVLIKDGKTYLARLRPASGAIDKIMSNKTSSHIYNLDDETTATKKKSDTKPLSYREALA